MAASTFDFDVTNGGYVCMSGSTNKYPIYKEIGGTWVQVFVSGEPLAVSGMNTCAVVAAPGKYQIRYYEGTCSSSQTPTFEYDDSMVGITPVVPASDAVPRVLAGSEQLAVTGDDVALSPPANANHAEIHVWTTPANGGVVWSVADAPDEAANVGTRSNNGATFELESAAELAAFKVDNLNGTTSSVLSVVYYELKVHVE